MIRALTLALALLAGMAHATPPRVTMSEDRILAATQTHLYVLRDISDNLGSNWVALHDQHLIEINLETGEATRFWPLRRMAKSHINDAGDFRVPGEVTERGGETYDMVAILRELGAEPLTPSRWVIEELSFSDGALMRGDEQLLTPFGIRKAGRAQLAILRDEYPDKKTDEGWPSEDQIDFYNLYAEGDWLCELRPEGQTLFRAQDRVTVTKLYCEDTELAGIWSFHVLIKDNLE